MSFRDDEQRARACVALCACVNLRGAWTLDGPAPLALAVAEGRAPLSSGEALLVRVAWAFWNGEHGPTLADLVGVLDPRRMNVVASLLVAHADGADAIDAWLDEHGPATHH